MFHSRNTITAIEVGSSSIKILMGTPIDGGSIGVIGYSEVSSLNKVVKGEVISVPEMEELLSEALNNVENVSGKKITSVYLAITGSHIESTNVIGNVPITSSDRIISEDDIIEATRNARSFNLPIEQRGIHTFHRKFLIDGHRRVNDPAGMVGNKLTADIHLIYGNYNKIQTICMLINDVLGAPAKDIAFSGIADFYGVSMEEDQINGVLIIDIGAGVTEYVVFHNNGCLHSGQLTVGCEHIANDLAIGLEIPIAKCREILKIKKLSLRKIDNAENEITIESSLGKPAKVVKESVLQTIIEARLTELFEIIKSELENSFIDEFLNMTQLLGDGIVLCGGGAMIADVSVIARSVFNVPARIGSPVNISGINEEIHSPRYITPIGLLHLGYKLNQLEKETSPSFRQTAESELYKIVSLCRRALRF